MIICDILCSNVWSQAGEAQVSFIPFDPSSFLLSYLNSKDFCRVQSLFLTQKQISPQGPRNSCLRAF